MTDYSDIEIQTAENLLKEGYKWITRSIYGAIIAYKIKPDKEKYISGNVICSDLVPIFESIRCGDEPVSLESIVHPQILDDAEKRYLKGVIMPFRKDIVEICKKQGKGYEYISFNGEKHFYLPFFDAGAMYKGMEPDRWYTLEKLGL
mgnify:CR=1 FL=1